MHERFELVEPALVPALDPGFRPPVLANRCFRDEVEGSGAAVPLVIAIERDSGRVSRHETQVFHADHPRAAANRPYVERLVKFLLWQWGGWKIFVGGSPELAAFLRECYAPGGIRAFDTKLWSDVYSKEFTVTAAAADSVPAATADAGSRVVLNWKGWRIGFDLGASDRKVAVVKDGALALDTDGSPLLSAEFVWDPKSRSDPAWHYAQIMEILRLAEARVREVAPEARVQAIGGSAAGVYVNGTVRIASLFRGVQPRARFEREVAPLFQRLQQEWGVPLRLENDGDVTALAGAIALRDGAVLGLAMGSSLAAGYVDDDRCVRGWMNELAFVPVDYQPEAPIDEWSGDRGVGANYFSQQAVGRLIPAAGIDMPDIPVEALPERLKRVQERLARGDERARRIYETIGVYFGYTVAHFCDFYAPVRHVEVLGRVMSGEGGQVILTKAREVLDQEFGDRPAVPAFYEPNEREKRHGQAAAAASLPLVQ